MRNVVDLTNKFQNPKIPKKSTIVITDGLTDTIFSFMLEFYSNTSNPGQVYTDALENYQTLMEKCHIPTILPNQKFDDNLFKKFITDSNLNQTRQIQLVETGHNCLENIIGIYNDIWCQNPKLVKKYEIKPIMTSQSAFTNAIRFQANEFLKYLNSEPSILKLPNHLKLINDNSKPGYLKQCILSKNKLSFAPAQYFPDGTFNPQVFLDITENELQFDIN